MRYTDDICADLENEIARRQKWIADARQKSRWIAELSLHVESSRMTEDAERVNAETDRIISVMKTQIREMNETIARLRGSV